MADGTIQLPPDSTGPLLDTETLTVGVNSVHRERHQIAGDSATDIAPVTAADGMTVNLGTNNDVVDTAAEASLAIIDDWDEADRAKVNPIAGQAGVAAGAGAVSALTQRVTLASDDPAVAALQVLDNIVAGSEAQVDVVTLPAGSQAGATVKTADYDTGAGTDTVPMQGIALPASGGAVAGGTATDPVRIDPTGSTTQPVSGTVAVTGVSTLTEQQTQTTHLAAIETAVEILDNIVAGAEAQVDVVTSALPTGASTLAEQQTQTTHLATIAGDTTAIETAVQIIDDWDESDRAKVNPIVGQAGVAADAGAVGATVQRVVQANGAGKTILSTGGSAASSGNNTLVAAGTGRLKVVAFSLTTTSATAVTCIFQSGAGGTELWRVVLQAAASTSTGANLSTAVPGWLFATASATLLNLNLSGAITVHWSVSYFDEA